MTPTALSPDFVVQLERDVAATLGDRHRQLVAVAAQNVRDLEVIDPTDKLVGDVQQTIHDLFIDTDWPACPRHGHHPLWFHDGAWWCEQDGIRIAPIGQLTVSS